MTIKQQARIGFAFAVLAVIDLLWLLPAMLLNWPGIYLGLGVLVVCGAVVSTLLPKMRD